MENIKDIFRVLKNRMESLGLKSKDLAEASDYSNNRISSIFKILEDENQKGQETTFPISTLFAFLQILQLKMVFVENSIENPLGMKENCFIINPLYGIAKPVNTIEDNITTL